MKANQNQVCSKFKNAQCEQAATQNLGSDYQESTANIKEVFNLK